MIKELKIIVNNDTFIMNKSGNVIGNIYFNIDGINFPDEGWSDFIIVILIWWIEAISKINPKRKSDTFQLGFMEGPLFVRGYVKGENVTELEFTKERSNKSEIFFTSTCSISQMQISIYQAAKEILKQAETRGWDSDDIKRLKYLTE